MRKFGVGVVIVIVALAVMFFAIRFLVGTLAFLLQLALAVGGVAVLSYVAYELWTGWKRAG